MIVGDEAGDRARKLLQIVSGQRQGDGSLVRVRRSTGSEDLAGFEPGRSLQ
jgi:hypothetical protein